MDVGVDVYFDALDTTLAELVEQGDADKITGRIRDGIEASTHMLCVVSHHTINSFWVPFEVGYGYGKKPLGVLTLRDLSNSELPDYMKTTEIILRGAKSLHQFVAHLLRETEGTLDEAALVDVQTRSAHLLTSVLDPRG